MSPRQSYNPIGLSIFALGVHMLYKSTFECVCVTGYLPMYLNTVLFYRIFVQGALLYLRLFFKLRLSSLQLTSHVLVFIHHKVLLVCTCL